MTQRRVFQAMIVLVLLLTLAACGRKSTPPTNPPAVETSLAGTARAFAKQTEAARPTATPTFTPTVTMTPTPRISLNGTSLEFLEGQISIFTDHKAGIKLIIPAGWMPFRVNEQEYYDAFTSDVVLANPALNERLTQVQDMDLEFFRLDAFDIREGHIPNGVISDMNVIFHAGDTRSLDKWAKAEGNRKIPYKQYRLVSLGYSKTTDDTRILVIDRTWAVNKSDTLFNRSVFFSIPTGTVVLNLYCNNTFKETVLPDFESVVNSLTLLNAQ